MTREERALKNLKQMCSDGRYLGSGSYVPLEVLEDFEVAIEAIEQESRKGYWIDADGDNAICGCCNRLNHLYGEYCKHCGVKMNKE